MKNPSEYRGSALVELFAQNLRRLRMQKGISQEKLAELAGFHRTYVSQVERGVGNVSLVNIERLASVLQVKPYRLLKEQKSNAENVAAPDPISES